jgi:type II secretory pathway pseudopilin PulG
MKRERGASLIETVVALALLGIIAVTFLSALATTSSSRLKADEHVSARIIAETQMENLRKQDYASTYDPMPISSDFLGYSALINVDNLRNGNLQKITVTVRHHNRDIYSLESYKAN